MHRSGRYASLREGLVGAWCPSVSGSFGYSLPDLSGYGNNGTLTNMDPPNDWVASGGKMALDFDGVNDYVQAPAPLIASITDDATISIWCKLNTTGQTQSLFSAGMNVTDVQRMQAHVPWTDNNIYFDYGGFLGSNRLTISGQTWNTTKWDHFVFISARNGLFVFRNGLLIGSTSTGVTRQVSSASFQLGTFNYTPEFYYPGCIDDCRVYNRALTPSEIQLLYTGGRGVGLMPERRRWFYFPSAFTGTASLTTGSATCSGSATHTTPTYTGTSGVTTAAATCSASGTFTKPVYSATSSVTIAAATCSATGTFTKPVYSGTSTLTVGHATASGAATFVAPVYTASASVAVGATVVNVAGSVVSPTFTGTAAVSVPAATITATGTFSQFSQITASKPRRLNIVTHRASLNIATHAHVST